MGGGLFDKVANESSSLFLHRLFQFGIPLREHAGIGWHIPDPAGLQPLADKVIVEGRGLGIREHPIDLSNQLFPVALQFAIFRKRSQLGIRHRAPEKDT